MNKPTMLEQKIRLVACLFAVALCVPHAHLLAQSGTKPRPAASRAAGSGSQPAASDPAAHAEARLAAAAGAFEAGRFEDAATLFQEVVTLDPKHALAWHFLGQSLEKTGRREEARAAFGKSLELQPGGALAERNTRMLAQLRRSGPPTMPASVSPATREVILKNPLFTSLPDTRALRCSGHESRTGGNLHGESFFSSVYRTGVGGMFSVDYQNRGRVGQKPWSSSGTDVQTLGGMLRFPHEIGAADGTLFPLKSGNRFSFRYFEAIGSRSRSWRDSCEVLEQVRVSGLDVNDAFRVKCDRTFVDTDPKAPRRDVSKILYVCSDSLGLCPLEWWGEAGDAAPNFAGGYSYVEPERGRIAIQYACQLVP